MSLDTVLTPSLSALFTRFWLAVLMLAALSSCSATKLLQETAAHARLRESSLCQSEAGGGIRIQIVDSAGGRLGMGPAVRRTKSKFIPALVYWHRLMTDEIRLGRSNLSPNFVGNLGCHLEQGLIERNLAARLGPGELTVVLDSVGTAMPYTYEYTVIFLFFALTQYSDTYMGPGRMNYRMHYRFLPDSAARPPLGGRTAYNGYTLQQRPGGFQSRRSFANEYSAYYLSELEKSLAPVSAQILTGLEQEANLPPLPVMPTYVEGKN